MRTLILAALGIPAGCVSPSGGWNLQASATSGAAIVYATADGDQLRIACRRNPSDLMVHAESLRAEGGIDRLAIRSGPYEAVLSLSAAEEAPGVMAVGPAPGTIYQIIGNGAPITVQYGKQALAAPPLTPADRAAFSAACRASG